MEPKDVEVPIMWVTCDEDFQEYLGLNGYTGELPMVLWNMDEASADEDGVDVKMGDQELVLGAMLFLNDALEGKLPEEANVSTEALIHVLTRAQESYGFPNLEELVLWIAEFAKDNIDSIIGHEMLKGGTALVPESSKIRAEQIFIAWLLAHETGSLETLEPIIDTFNKIDLQKLDGEARQAVCYYAMCTATIFGDKEESERIYNDFVIPHVFDLGLLERLDVIRRDPKALGIHELTLGID